MNYLKTQVESSYNIFPSYLNRHNTLFGGQILYWVDEVMGLVIRKYTSIPFVTATIDNYQFLGSVPKEDMLTIKSYISGVGTRSVEVFTEISAFNHTERSTRVVGICFSTFSVRGDITLEKSLEKIEFNDEISKFVSSGYTDRKKGVFSYREFTKNYINIFNKQGE